MIQLVCMYQSSFRKRYRNNKNNPKNIHPSDALCLQNQSRHCYTHWHICI